MDSDTAALIIFVWAPLLALIPAGIAASKGRNFFGWWIYGWAIWIVALPHALLAGPDGRKRRCPYCAETVRVAATVCPHCRNDISGREET